MSRPRLRPGRGRCLKLEVTPDTAETPPVGDRAFHFVKAVAVHEHHTVHEVNTALPTGTDHFAEVGGRSGAGFLAQDMLAGRRRAYDPLLTDPGRKQDETASISSDRRSSS